MHDAVAHLGPLHEHSLHRETGLFTQPADKPTTGSRQAVEEGEGEVAQIEDQQAIGGQPGQQGGQKRLIVGRRVLGVPDLDRQMRHQIADGA